MSPLRDARRDFVAAVCILALFQKPIYCIDFRSSNYRLPVLPESITETNRLSWKPYLNPYEELAANSQPQSLTSPRTTFSSPPPPPPSTTTTTITTNYHTLTPSTTNKPVWTTTTAKSVLKLSKNPKKSKSDAKNSKRVDQLNVVSHRLLQDIIVIGSSRRLYVLVIAPIHQASSDDSSAFACGDIDVNAVVRLTAFLDAMQTMNESPMLKQIGAEIGTIVVDTCSTDLRTVADLYELLLGGTNIKKSDLIAVVRDDSTFMPNVDKVLDMLGVPIIETVFGSGKNTGVLPSLSHPIATILSALHFYKSTCVNLIYDDSYANWAEELREQAASSSMCVEKSVHLSAIETPPSDAIRTLLLAESRIVVAMLSEHSWLELIDGLRAEMVISGRFVFVAVAQDPRWSTASKFVDAWSHFEQHLVAVDVKAEEAPELRRIADILMQRSSLLPSAWLRQFWTSAFHCHLSHDDPAQQRFSKECAQAQPFDVLAVAPHVSVAPLQIAAHLLAGAFRQFVDASCPGALLVSIADCVNDPFAAYRRALVDFSFEHRMAPQEVRIDAGTGYRHVELQLNRVLFDDERISYSPLGSWLFSSGYHDFSSNTTHTNTTARGSHLLMSSNCARSKCSMELSRRALQQSPPSMLKSLTDLDMMLFTILAVLSSLACLMCTYLKVISSSEYRNSTALTFVGLALVAVSAPFFLIAPNSPSCVVRQLLFPVALSTAMAPIAVKSLCIWRSAEPVRSAHLAILAVVLLQIVMSTEWLLLTAPDSIDIVFAVSNRGGTMWRCSGGEMAELSLLASCAMSALLAVASLVLSLAALRHPQSIQHLLISMIVIVLSAILYFALPLLAFKTRDVLMATCCLTFSFLSLLISHLNSCSPSPQEESLYQKSASNASSETWQRRVAHYVSDDPSSTYS